MTDRQYETPKEVIGKVTRTRQSLDAYGGDVTRAREYLKSDAVTIIYLKEVSSIEAAKQISERAWARMMRARNGDFSSVSEKESEDPSVLFDPKNIESNDGRHPGWAGGRSVDYDAGDPMHGPKQIRIPRNRE